VFSLACTAHSRENC